MMDLKVYVTLSLSTSQGVLLDKIIHVVCSYGFFL